MLNNSVNYSSLLWISNIGNSRIREKYKICTDNKPDISQTERLFKNSWVISNSKHDFEKRNEYDCKSERDYRRKSKDSRKYSERNKSTQRVSDSNSKMKSYKYEPKPVSSAVPIPIVSNAGWFSQRFVKNQQ